MATAPRDARGVSTAGGVDDSRPREESERQPVFPPLQAIVEPMTEAVLVLDRAGMVVAVNDALMTLLDMRDRAAALRPIAEYDQFIRDWRVGDDPFAPDDLRRSLDGASIRRQRATLTTAAGTERIIEFSTTPIPDSDGVVQFAMLVAQDLTVAERTRVYWEAVGTAAQGLTSELDVDRVLQSAIDMIVASFGDRVVLGIWRLNETRERLELQIHRGISQATADLLRTLPIDCPSFICDAVRKREPQFIEDTGATTPLGEIDRQLVAAEGLSSWIASPLLTGLNMIGSMGYGLRTPQRFYHQDLEAVRTIGRLFAVAIEHAELYEESQRQRDALERTASERHRLVSTLAHDLGTPLTVLRASAELAARPSTSPVDRQEILAAMTEQVDRAVHLLDDLSEAYLTDRPQYAINRARIDLVPLLREIVLAIHVTAPEHHLRLDTPDELVGEWDPQRLARVFANLLTNVVKFSPAGSDVLVRMGTVSDDVLITITDQGVGLEAHDLFKIFEPFTRVGAPEQTEGSGLGLFIARSIVEAHGGKLWAESAGPGMGTTMSVALPHGRSQSVLTGGVVEAR